MNMSRSRSRKADADEQSLIWSPSAATRKSVPPVPPRAKDGRARLLTARWHFWVLTQPVVEPTISELHILWEIKNIFLAYSTTNFCLLLLTAEGILNLPQNKTCYTNTSKRTWDRRSRESWQGVTPPEAAMPRGEHSQRQRQRRVVRAGLQSLWATLRKLFYLPKAPFIHENNGIKKMLKIKVGNACGRLNSFWHLTKCSKLLLCYLFLYTWFSILNRFFH